MVKFYKTKDGSMVLGPHLIPSGTLVASFEGDKVRIHAIGDKLTEYYYGLITNIGYDTGGGSFAACTDLDDFIENLSDFFVNPLNPLQEEVEGLREDVSAIQGTPQVIDLLPGQYLSDVIQSITDASETKQYTINFYNHSKTINWDTFTQKIHVPRFIHINFVGNIDWWPNFYYPQIGFDEGLTDLNPIDKLFIGFSFDRTNDAGFTHISGLPTNLWKIFFGGLDSSWNVASEYQDLIDDPDDWGIGTLGLVRVNGSKEDDSRNDALYKKINDVFIDVTPEFMYCDFSSCNLNNAYFYSANCQSAYFDSTNCELANFQSANCKLANFHSANCKSANFQSANCQSAYFHSANCQSAYFYSANCQSAYFDSTNCELANFQSANCKLANFHSANCKSANFDSTNCELAYFDSTNCELANFQSANLKNVSWSGVISIVGANFRNADLTGGRNLPTRINTKAKWIAECGASNVNAETIWIDGTSILS